MGLFKGMKDMANLMSKILNQNVPLADVIRMSTINPATQIKRPELGHLSVGAGADVALLPESVLRRRTAVTGEKALRIRPEVLP